MMHLPYTKLPVAVVENIGLLNRKWDWALGK